MKMFRLVGLHYMQYNLIPTSFSAPPKQSQNILYNESSIKDNTLELSI